MSRQEGPSIMTRAVRPPAGGGERVPEDMARGVVASGAQVLTALAVFFAPVQPLEAL